MWTRVEVFQRFPKPARVLDKVRRDRRDGDSAHVDLASAREYAPRQERMGGGSPLLSNSLIQNWD